ncbi:MAG: hypothetical protein IJJ07_02885 [Lachnospiraceae bacterium]|nr:hypothetical protein [Lachnospiraceae bacterium]
MKKRVVTKKLASIAVAAAMILSLSGILPAAAHAESFQFITDIRIEAGEDAYQALEDDGYSVRSVGLNANSGDGQIYLGYKINDGDPVTNVVISADVGDAFDSEDGIHYVSAGHVDAEAGNGEGGGCVYMTQDPKAGAPLVGLDILRAGGSTMGADLAKKEPLLPITNDGAEIVRKTDGTPADLEVNSADTTIYLAQVRDGLVKAYIKDVTVITAASKEDAVFTAASNGYNYYVDGDVDASGETYTLLAYERTADRDEAIRSLIAVSADLTTLMENDQIIAGSEEAPAEKTAEEEPAAEEEAASQEQTEEPAAEDEAAAEEQTGVSEEEAQQAAGEVQEDTSSDVPDGTEVQMTAAAIDISGVEYDRLTETQIAGDTPYFLYISKDEKAGNPITMIYAGDSTDVTETTLGAWVYGYFTAKGQSSASSYVINEDKLESLQDKDSVYVKMPVNLLTGEAGEGGIALQTTPLTLSYLTGQKGLPEGSLVLNGLTKATYDPPQIARNYNGAESDLPASAFGRTSAVIIILGVLAITAAVIVSTRVMKKRKAEQEAKENASK